jgi:hypothetical protein
LGNWVSGVRYLRNAPDILLANYVSAAFREINGLNINSMIDNSVKNSGIPYAVPTPETYYVHVSSEAQVRELSEASEAHLSLHAWAKDVSQFYLCREHMLKNLFISSIAGFAAYIHHGWP